MLSALKSSLLLIDLNLKKQLILIFFITIIGTFLETLGIGIIFPILKIIVEGEEFIKNYHTNYAYINHFIEYLSSKNYIELISFLLFLVILVFFIKTIFFLYLVNKQTKL